MSASNTGCGWYASRALALLEGHSPADPGTMTDIDQLFLRYIRRPAPVEQVQADVEVFGRVTFASAMRVLFDNMGLVPIEDTVDTWVSSANDRLQRGLGVQDDDFDVALHEKLLELAVSGLAAGSSAGSL